MEINIKDGYKVTEVGVIPDDWEVKKLKDCLIQNPDYGINAPAVPYLDNLPTYIRITDISEDGNFLAQNKVSVIHHNANNYFLEFGDIVLARTGASTGKSYLYNVKDGKLVFAGFLIRVKPDTQKLYPRYLKGCLETQAYWNWVKVMSMRSGQPGINSNEYSQLQIPLPPLAEQKAIAHALSDVDNLITAIDQLITKKRNLKQGTMQELLTGKKRLPGFSGKWEVKKLGDIANIQRGASPRPIDSPIWYDITSSVGWVRISDITASNGRILEKTKDYLSQQGIAQSRFLPAGSLIMSICATVGIPVITNIDTCIHDGFVGFTKLNDIDKVFFYYKLKELENNFKSMGQTGSQNNLNTNLVKKYPIPLPPLPEQKAIAEILTDIDTEIEALEKKRDKYKAIKQGMMQELLTGKTRISK